MFETMTLPETNSSSPEKIDWLEDEDSLKREVLAYFQKLFLLV